MKDKFDSWLFENSQEFVEKVRKIRGDGNCFYRALIH